MVKFAPPRHRWGHFEIDLPWEDMEQVLGLVKDLGINLVFKEIPPPGSEPKVSQYAVAASQATPRRPYYRGSGVGEAWYEKMWASMKPVFEHYKTVKHGPIHAHDHMLVEAVRAAGRNIGSIGTALSWCAKKNLLLRPFKGYYELP